MQYVKITEANSLITLGRQGEYGVRTIVFDDYGFDTAIALVKRQGDSGTYQISLTHNEDVFQWPVGAYDVANAGYGKAQIKYYTDDVCQKTVIFDTRTHKSMDATEEPEGYINGDAINIDNTDKSINVLFDSDTLALNDANELTVIGGGGGTTYTAGNAINIDNTNNSINVLFDDTLSLNDANELTVVGGGESYDPTVMNLTEANLVWETEEETNDTPITYIMTTGEDAEDTLVWYEGSTTLDIAEHSEIASIEAGAQLIDIATYEPGYQDADEVYMRFDNPEEATAGEWAQMRWSVDNGTFTIELLNASGAVVSTGTIDATGKIAHYMAMLSGVSGLTMNTVRGKINDPIYPLPHDSRLPVAFDKRGYITVGNKKVQIIDLTKEDVKDIDTNDVYYFFDGTNTLIYDFYRKDFTLIDSTNQEPVNIELEMNTEDHGPATYAMGVYRQDDTYQIPEQMLEFSETSSQRAYYLQFKATWNDDTGMFNCRWTVKDYNRQSIAQSDVYETNGAVGMYLSIPGEISMKDYIYGVYSSEGTYSRFNPKTATAESMKAEWWRDVCTTISDDRLSFDTVFEYGAGYKEEMPKNYYITNGQIVAVPNESLPLGTWTFEWRDIYDATVGSETYTEATDDDRLQMVRFIREGQGLKTIIKHNSNNYKIIDIGFERQAYMNFRITWSSETAIGEDVEPLYEGDTNAIFERFYETNIATSSDFGSVKYDDLTIKMNDGGQLYSNEVFMAEYGTTTYDELLIAYNDGKKILMNALVENERYYAALGKFIESTGTFFFPTTTYEGYLVQYICNYNSGWTYEQTQVQSKLTTGTGIDITSGTISARTDNTSITVNANGELCLVQALEERIARLEALLNEKES